VKKVVLGTLEAFTGREERPLHGRGPDGQDFNRAGRLFLLLVNITDFHGVKGRP